MSQELDLVYKTIDEQHGTESAMTRRKMVAGAAATIGGLGLFGAVPSIARGQSGVNDPQTILNIAATAEVLATIVNTVGAERVNLGDATTRRNVRAAAREELEHYDALVKFGGKPLTKKIWVPNVVFSSRTALLSTLEVGDQIFVNAYLIAVRTFGNAGNGPLATIAAEFMGVEAVHRALARQSLGKLGNDRVFILFNNEEPAFDAPNRGQRGFTDVTVAAARLQAAGFGFGVEGSLPGQFYSFDSVRQRTPDNIPGLNNFVPDGN